jgi:Reverse transcriptase (RNA-dependent DNA polymerase)
VILTFAAAHDLEIMASDVKTAFLYCCLHSELYCKQIPGYPFPDPSTVLHVLVALYGLRQSAFEFYTLLFHCFQSLGMCCCEVDHTVFYGSWSSFPYPSVPPLSSGTPLFTIISIHVDNGPIACNSLLLYSWIISKLQKMLEIIDISPASLYLGNRIMCDCSHCKLWLSQKSYCVKLLCT